MKLTFGIAALTGFLATVIYIVTIITRKDLGTYGGLFLLCFCPLVMGAVIGWCYALVYLEQAKFLAPHFVFRFLIPLLLLSSIAWLSVRNIYMPKFQNYSLQQYLRIVGEFAFDFLLPLTLVAALVSVVLTICCNTAK
ncbi:hypothetical protein [Chitinophaga arvensicola]|uniref:Uncharacterized protein n=1 Tax=Chitinophaga arvensicola TaxID=29529 RepID=A0A1I0SAE3_9BACT|nr:hypothetical protein [Chitinophaga arvensicola]SEW53308.1 hypothetical protein SAMN04488122_5409 [Chitinophaga arvensicola]